LNTSTVAGINALVSGFWLEEKYDGSQLSFMLSEGVIHYYNKGSEKAQNAKVWKDTIEQINTLKYMLKEGYTYHWETINSIR
jgi:hypothetical protein